MGSSAHDARDNNDAKPNRPTRPRHRRAAVHTTSGGGFFVASYTPDGDYRWSIAGTDGGIAHAIELGADGQLYLTGQSAEGMQLAGETIAGAGLLVASFTTGGELRWHREYEAEASGRGIAATADGSVYVTGQFSGELPFGDTPVFSDDAQLFLFKLEYN